MRLSLSENEDENKYCTECHVHMHQKQYDEHIKDANHPYFNGCICNLCKLNVPGYWHLQHINLHHVRPDCVQFCRGFFICKECSQFIEACEACVEEHLYMHNLERAKVFIATSILLLKNDRCNLNVDCIREIARHVCAKNDAIHDNCRKCVICPTRNIKWDSRICSICNLSIHSSELQWHALSHKHCPTNYTYCNNCYKCNICGEILEYCELCVELHTKQHDPSQKIKNKYHYCGKEYAHDINASSSGKPIINCGFCMH